MDRSGSASGAEVMVKRSKTVSDGGPGPGDSVEVAVRALDDAARGIAATDQGVEVRIPGVLPGERARGEVVHVDRHRRRHARFLAVVEPVPDRVPADCGHFLDCGGCDLLHAALPAQHRFKRALVAEALERALSEVAPVVASPRALGYRALAKLVVGPGGALGSYRPRSHDVVDMAGCLVHAPEAEGIVAAIRGLLQEAEAAAPIELRYALVRASLDERRAIVLLVIRRPDARGLDRLVRMLEARDDVAVVAVHVNDSPGDELLGPEPYRVVVDKGPLRERIGENVHVLAPGAFAQVNPLAAAELYRVVAGLLQPRLGEGAEVLDLYAGSGGIALALARAGAARVVAVEASEQALAAARASSAASGLTVRVELTGGSVEAALQDLRGRAFAAIVLNPPRKGASVEALRGIVALGAPALVYVSCDPATLARDLAVLAAEGYAAREVVPVDLFPQTRHVETVVHLLRAQ